MSETAFKKVTSRGKRYVYLRGTNIALVRGFLGTENELDGLLAGETISQAIEDHRRCGSASLAGWRTDAAKMLHRTTKNRANGRERLYGLSVEAITDMLRDAHDRCQVTGLRFDYGPKTEAAWLRRPMAPSLDRISNKGGYEPVNVRVVCVCVNVAINEWGLANFEKMCRAFVSRNGK